MSNLLKRTLSGAAFVLLIILSLVWWPSVYPVVVSLLLIELLREFYKVSLGDSLGPERLLATASAVLAFILFFAARRYGLPYRFVLIAALPLLSTFLLWIFRRDRSAFGSFPTIFLGLGYVALPVVLSPLVIVRDGVFDGWLLLDFFIIVWCADVGAYVFGTLFGQKPTSRKLAPDISPKKSWWGFWSAVVFGFCASLTLMYLGRLVVPVAHAVALGVLVSVGAVCGDLFESVWKRHFCIKDSGSVIPGHGGLLDRFDSSLVAMPLGVIYLAIFGLL